MGRPRRRPLTRREALTWLTALAGLGGAGVCATGGILSVLIGRHRLIPTQIVATPPPVQTPAPPPIVPRVAWGARPINHEAPNERGFYSAENPLGWREYEGDLADIYTTLVIHHSYPILRDSGTMRDVQNAHLDAQGWADVGYHFAVDGKGTIYEGRDIRVRGSNVAGYNTGVIGVVAIGDFDNEAPSLPQLQAIMQLALWLRDAYTLTHIAGHYEFNPTTACPGVNMKPYLEQFSAYSGLVRGTGGYTPLPGRRAIPTPSQCC